MLGLRMYAMICGVCGYHRQPFSAFLITHWQTLHAHARASAHDLRSTFGGPRPLDGSSQDAEVHLKMRKIS
jgi:hypothetical protein